MSSSFSYRLFTNLIAIAVASATLSAAQSKPPQNADTSSQEAVVFERFDRAIRFEDDGTGSQETTAVVHVQSQAGVQEVGQLIIGYSSATEKLEIDYVRVRKPDGQTIETPPTSAQDFAPEVLRQAPTYTDYRQRHISVAGLQAGDTLEYHTITHISAPLAPHEFWYQHSFLRDVAVREQKLEISVPKGRAVKLKSPDHKFETRDAEGRRTYTWTMEFIPDRKHSPEAEVAEAENTPDVQISSFTDWAQVARWYSKLQSESVVVDDSIRKRVADLTAGARTPAEKSRRLYDFVALKIRYVSISFGVGRLQPHAAPEVLQNGFGDCKDKHTLLQAMLQAAGVQSYPVLIGSNRDLDPDIPSPAQFDHEITALEIGGNGLTWLDSTAEVAPYGLLLYQLRNRQALVAADGKWSGLQRTPAISPVKNQLSIKLNGMFSETGAFDTTVEIAAQGDTSLPLRMTFRSIPEARWTEVLKNFSALWGLAGDVSDIHFDPLEDTSKPFHLTYRYHKDNYFVVPTSGVNFRILPPMRLRVVAPVDPKKPMKPLDVGPAGEQNYHAHIQFPVNYAIQLAPTARMSRDYGEYSVSYDLGNNVLEADRRVVLKVDELPASRRSDYESFENATRNEVQQFLTAAIRPASAVAVAAAAKVSGGPEELRKAGVSAMQRQDFSGAAELLKRSLEGDPKQRDIWDDLGRAYASQGEHDEAIRAFRKQLEVDAFHKTANQELAGELEKTGKFDEAVAAYRQQLEITPFNKATHNNLGSLLAEHQRDPEAIKEYEAAAAIPPEDPQVALALGRLYRRTGETAKSQALLKTVTGVTASSSNSDLYVSALREDIDPNQTWRDARKTLDSIGDQFDSGEFDHPGPSAFHAMDLVSLAWARIGWSKYLQGEYMEAIGFLQSAWLLSQSGTVGNRLARVLEKEGQKDAVRHALALACAAGGGDAALSREELLKRSGPADTQKAITDAAAELVQMRTIKFAAQPYSGSSQFALTFEGSSKPERVDWLEGAPDMRKMVELVREKEFPVRFPDVSSVKIVRKASLSCDASACSLVLLPLEGLQSDTEASAKK